MALNPKIKYSIKIMNIKNITILSIAIITSCSEKKGNLSDKKERIFYKTKIKILEENTNIKRLIHSSVFYFYGTTLNNDSVFQYSNNLKREKKIFFLKAKKKNFIVVINQEDSLLSGVYLLDSNNNSRKAVINSGTSLVLYNFYYLEGLFLYCNVEHENYPNMEYLRDLDDFSNLEAFFKFNDCKITQKTNDPFSKFYDGSVWLEW